MEDPRPGVLRRPRTGDQLRLRGGHHVPGTLQLTSGDTGTAANPVIIDSYGTGRAVISSGAGQGVSVYNAAGIDGARPEIVGAGRDTGGDVGVLFYNDLAGTSCCRTSG